MRFLLYVCSLAIGSSVLVGQTVVPPSGFRRNLLTNPGVALLAQAGYSERFIIDMIYYKQTQFDVSAEGLAWLAKQGLSERIIRTMVINENKEEQTAIYPSAMALALPPAFTPPPAAAFPGRGPIGGLRVVGPTLAPAAASTEVRGLDGDRSSSNIPLLVVGQR